MAIIQAIPGAGKTTLASTARFDLIIDTDDIIASLGYEGRFNMLLKDPGATRSFFNRLRAHDADCRTIVTNLWLEQFRMLPADIKFAYKWQEYVRHLEISKRSDLLSTFTRSTLEGWARDYEGHANVYWLKPGEWIGDVLMQQSGKPFYDELFNRWLKRRSRREYVMGTDEYRRYNNGEGPTQLDADAYE